MKRRDFIKFSAGGLTVLAVGSMGGWTKVLRGAQAHASGLLTSGVGLEMVEASAEMVDGVEVPMWAFKLGEGHAGHASVAGARIPGPVLVALEGDRVNLHIMNKISQGGAHGFAIPGVSLKHNGSNVSEITIAQGGMEEVEFTAPAAGTYMYLDPLNAPVNRVMGLHGALVVLPNPIGNNTPYSGLSGSHSVRRLFDDLGTAAHFPGNPWDPNRNAVWVFNVVDPVKAAAVTGSSSAMPAATFLNGFLPQYFTLNGKSGFFSAQHGHDPGADHDGHDGFTLGIFNAQGNISLHGTVGQPLVIRCLNPGLMWHSPHIHGNHVYPIARSNILDGQDPEILTNLTMLDTWTLPPGEVMDLLHPFIAPPDIPANFWSRFNSGINDELFPLLYPMHDHNEISNTAAGGNYPQGLATHWQIDGPFDSANPATGIITIERADLRVKTGQLILEGHFTVPNQHLAVHAGGLNGPTISTMVQVGSDGRFSFRGRSLKAVSSRFVTLIHHDPLDMGTVHANRTVPLRLR